MVAVGVSHVVLHVSDQSVVPVCDIDRSIAADFHVAGTEVWIVRKQDRLNLFGCNICSVNADFVLQHAKESDCVTDQEISLVITREMAAGKKPRRCDWPNTFFKPLFVANPFTNVDVRTSSPCSIIGKLKTPAVDHVAVRIGANWKMKFEFKGSWVETVDARFTTSKRLRWSFKVRDVENPSRKIHPSIRSDDNSIGRVMRVGT